MKIVYLHGFGSRYKADSPKVNELKNIGHVVGFKIDYCMNADLLIEHVCDQISKQGVDLIVGTSMGGWLASQVGTLLGIPFVALNPAIDPRESLLRHLGTSVDYCGNNINMTNDIVDSYDRFNTGGCGLILLEEGDELFDFSVTESVLKVYYDVKIFKGGSHRFEDMKDTLELITNFKNQSELIYGS